jgi:hypothetical protein
VETSESNEGRYLEEEATLWIRSRRPASMRKGDIQHEGVNIDVLASPRLDPDICEVSHEVSG